MTEQTQTDGSPPGATVRGIGRLSQRVVSLCELQADLLKADLKDGLTAWKRSVALLLGGAILGMSSIPVLLLAVAHALREAAGFSWTAAFLAAALLGLGIAATALAIGWWRLRATLAVLDRSKQELRTNLRWLAETLKQSSSTDQS